jgi:hypothetical protein
MPNHKPIVDESQNVLIKGRQRWQSTLVDDQM